MNKTKNLALIVSLIIALLFIFLSGRNVYKPQEDIKIVRFTEDGGKDYEQKGFKVIKYDIRNYQDINVSRIWITFEFLKEEDNAPKIRCLLDKGYNVLIEGNNVYAEDVYDLLDIEQSRRKTNVSKKQDIENDKNSVLHKSGVLIFENNSNYFAVGFNRENVNDNEGFFTLLNMDDEQKKKMYGGAGYI